MGSLILHQSFVRSIPSSTALKFRQNPISQSNQRFNCKRMVFPGVCCCIPSSSDNGSEETQSSNSNGSVSAYAWCAGLGCIGVLETGYLSYLKFTGSSAFCPVSGGGGGCDDVLNSSYASVFGVPLPLLGFAAYSSVALLGILLTRRKIDLVIDSNVAQTLLLGISTLMAAASSYFLYILTTRLAGVSCTYCIASATLSFSLFFIMMKVYDFKEIQKTAGMQLSLAALVFAALTISYNAVGPDVAEGRANVDLPFFETEITKDSTPSAVALANHLRSIGAKMYGAFWCSHCLEQKEMLGKEAAKIIDYVECFPNGFHTGDKPAKACQDAHIDGFPTWIIKDQVLSGEQELAELAQVSDFKMVE